MYDEFSLVCANLLKNYNKIATIATGTSTNFLSFFLILFEKFEKSGSRREYEMRIHADPDPQPWTEQDEEWDNGNPGQERTKGAYRSRPKASMFAPLLSPKIVRLG